MSLNKNVRVGLSLVDNNFAHESISKKHPMLLVDQGKAAPQVVQQDRQNGDCSNPIYVGEILSAYYLLLVTTCSFSQRTIAATPTRTIY